MSAAPIAPQLVFAPNPSTTRATATPLSSHGTRLVYTSGRSVVLRDLAAPTATLLYAQHAHAVSVARISPSGYYCASGDVAGNIRVWDIAGSDMVLKLEKKAPGPVRDLAWDAESKRIAAVGDGKESFGTFFLADSGSSCGEVTGHSKVLNAVAIKPQRPFKAVTAGDDCSVVFYNGVPFKYGASTSAHTRFIQTLAYAPNGSVFASGGSDGKIQLYDGTTGAPTTALQAGGTAGQQAHAGTVFAVAFSQDSAQLLSAGADAALRLWDVGAQKVAQTFDLKNKSGGGANDQLVGACFVGKDRVVALALSGALHVIEIASSNATVLHGPTKAVGPSALALVDGAFLLGSYDGKVLSTSLDGACKLVQDAGAAITGMAQAGRGSAWVIGMDDTVRRFASGAFDSTSVSTSGQARSVAGSDAVALVATSQGLDVVSGSSKTSHAVGIDATAVALSPDGVTAAVGAENGKVLLGSISGGKWQPSMTFENGRRAVSALAFSPDGALLAAGETGGRIMVYDVKAGNLKLNQWVNHTGRINALAFSPDGSRAVSAGGDTNVYVWSVARPMKNVALRNAHAGGATGALWLDDTTIATAGADAALKTFKVPALP